MFRTQPSVAPVVLRVAAVLLLATAPAWAADTKLEASEGRLVVNAPGRWRAQSGSLDIAASGFLGVKRAELFATVYDDVQDAAAATQRWRSWRTNDGGEPVFAEAEGRALHWTAHSSGAGTVDYARVLTGAGRAAVVWVRLSGSPGDAASDAWAVLAAATLADKPEPAAGKEPTPEGAPEPEGVQFKDPALRIELTLPKGFVPRKDVTPDRRRGISVAGPVGTDKEAFLDVYLLDDFLRADAAGSWWQGAERRGWAETLLIEGDETTFRVDVPGETWSRHVRIVATDAGIVGFKLDVASQANQDALGFLERSLAALAVLKTRKSVPTPPPGFQEQTSEASVLQVEVGGATSAAKEFLFQADVVEEHVAAMLRIEPVEGRKSVLRVYGTDRALVNALRPLGVEDGRAAHWAPEVGAVLTHAAALGTPAGVAAVRSELARASVARRFGFRAPYWLERGIGEIVATAAYQKGRVDVPHPLHMRPAQDAAAQTVEFQTIRWWTHEDGVGHSERDAQVWGWAYFFLFGGADARKWDDSFRGYISQLRESADPEEAAKSFDLTRQVELAEDWKKFMRKL